MRTHVCECSVLVKNVGCTRIEQRGSLSDTSSPAACRWRNSDKEPHRCHSFFSQCYTLRCLKGIQLYNPLSAVLRNRWKKRSSILPLPFSSLIEWKSFVKPRTIQICRGLALNNEKNHPSINPLTWRLTPYFEIYLQLIAFNDGIKFDMWVLININLMEKIHFIGLKYY